MFGSTFRLSSYVVLGIAFLYSLVLATEFDLVSIAVPTHEKHQGIELDELLALSGIFSNLLAGLAVFNSWLGARERRGRAAVERAANRDALTAIANRRLFFDRLGAIFAAGAPIRCAVVLMDLDGFKAVNDSYGHAAGDAVLVHVARQISRLIGSAGTVARLGGDEFAVILDGRDADQDRAAALVERLRQAVAQPLRYRGAELRVGASIGLAFASPATPTPTALVELADGAMYHAKRKNRDRIAA